MAAATGGLVHLKTAGTSYLEALRTLALSAPRLFREIYAFCWEHYETDRASYHVSGRLDRAPSPSAGEEAALAEVLDQFDARQILHVTFGSVLTARTAEGRSRFADRLCAHVWSAAPRCMPRVSSGISFATSPRSWRLARDRQTPPTARRAVRPYVPGRQACGEYACMNLADVTHLYDFSGRTIVVTGATGVLGGEIACALVGCGANVAMLDRNLDPAKGLLDLMGPGATRAVVVNGDVLDRDSMQRASEEILTHFDHIDGLVNAAGGNRPEATTNPERSFFDLPADALRWVLDLNLLGTVLPSQVFAGSMARRGEGVILNLSSMSAFRPLTRVAGYSAAKAGISNFTQWLAVHMAQEYSPRIRVNAVAPGFFLTRQNRFLLTDEATGELTPRGQTIIAHTPMGRFGQPEDLLGAVLWLLSPASAFVTGIVLPVDGGFSAFSGV